MSNDRISMLARTLIPQGQIDTSKEYIDVSKCYIAFYKDKRSKKYRVANDDGYKFGIFRLILNEKCGPYFRSLDNKLFGFFDPNNSIKINTIKSEVEYKVNCSIIEANSFDNVRLLLRNCNYIDDYIHGKATKEEIDKVLTIVEFNYRYYGISFLLDKLNNTNGKRQRS